jgi:hypothetical protein
MGAITIDMPSDIPIRARASINRDPVVGQRYNARADSEVDAEEY